ncbi:transposase domain-containing protein, partial [Streptomyces sp. NPDC014983]|uniref:transposase domain-containing protein n=1 Tax=Streptomyces sp. NPDC014983 TaxID=3364933 RepID=UPI0036FCD38C
MREKSVITRTIEVAGGVFAPGHLGELTQIVDFALVDALLVETRAVQRRVRLLPARVVVYFVLALALFEDCSYQAVWDKLTAGLAGLPLTRPHTSSLSRARRRLG